ncbi:hypothetical protein QYF61_001108 [Mycteria americana]|uniref:Reverse transcriptase domain-containing protein n=1 Tax=Mycteria americana TaxID=33587 RepID=A0AAN7N1C8_MYCAM|nr:hypothetical protein QYF61_001108 [Mycteria americana]
MHVEESLFVTHVCNYPNALQHWCGINSLVKQGSGFRQFVRILLPWLGVSKLEKAIVNLSAMLENIENATSDAIQALQQEATQVSQTIVQNCLALDYLLATQGGICALDTAGSIYYVNQDLRIEIDLKKSWERLKPLHQNTPRPKEEIPVQMEDAVTPLIWASRIPGWSKLAELVKVVLKSGTKPVRQKQYPIKWEARKGLEELIKKFLNYALLIECESEYNTPILPVKKQNGKEYGLVQDLRAVNQIVQDIHPVVANPYTLPTSLKEKHKWFTVLDLKDAFFCIPLDRDSQAYLPLNGKAPPLEARHNSPGQCYLKGSKIVLQYLYVDDILIAAETREDRLQATISLLNFWDKQDTEYQKARPRLGKRL